MSRFHALPPLVLVCESTTRRKLSCHVLNTEGNESLWLRHLSSESIVQIIPPQHVAYSALRFSPDGKPYLLFTYTLLASGPQRRSMIFTAFLCWWNSSVSGR